MSRAADKIMKNSVYSFLGFFWPLALSFFAMPILIHQLGLAEYGKFVLLNSAIGVVGLLDFGFSYTFIKNLSASFQNREDNQLNKIFGATIILYFIISIIALAAALLLLPFALSMIKGLAIASLQWRVFVILGVSIFFKMLSSPFISVPFALQRQDVVAKINMVNLTLSQLGGIAAVYAGLGLIGVLTAQMFAAIFVFFYFYWWKITHVPSLVFTARVDNEIYKMISINSFWVSASSFMNNLLSQWDKFIVGWFLGASSVTYYATAQMLPDKIQVTSMNMTQIFFPFFSNINEKGGYELKNIFRRVFNFLIAIVSGLALTVLLFGGPFIKLWIGKEFDQQIKTTITVLTFAYILLAVYSFLGAFLNGVKMIKFGALAAGLMGTLDIFMCIILVPKLGIDGAAWAYLISVLPVPLFIIYIERHKKKLKILLVGTPLCC